jgi:hypothetical protein
MNRLIIAAGVVALTAAMPEPAAAELYPYCAWYNNQGTNCGFPTMWSCQAAISGVGGYCGINPRWAVQNRGAYNGPPPYNPRSGRAPPPPFR